MKLLTALDERDDSTDAFVTTFPVSTMPFTNWSPHRVTVWGKRFATAEHAFQFRKFADTDPALASAIRRADCPSEAKRLAWSKPIDTMLWDSQREKIMFEILAAKLAQYQQIRQLLVDTSGRAIIQKADGPDLFWGVDRYGHGRNTMGFLWMSLRERL